MIRPLSNKELKELKVLKTVNAGANTKRAVIGNKQSNKNPKIDPRVVAATSNKVRA